MGAQRHIARAAHKKLVKYDTTKKNSEQELVDVIERADLIEMKEGNGMERQNKNKNN